MPGLATAFALRQFGRPDREASSVFAWRGRRLFPANVVKKEDHIWATEQLSRAVSNFTSRCGMSEVLVSERTGDLGMMAGAFQLP